MVYEKGFSKIKGLTYYNTIHPLRQILNISLV